MAKKKPETKMVWVKSKTGTYFLRRVSAKKRKADPACGSGRPHGCGPL